MRILGTGRAQPQKVVKNEDLATFLDTSDEWIVSRTGIHTRRVLTGESLRGLALTAAQNALAMAEVSPAQIDFILFSTVLGDYITPGMGCILQGDLGASCPAVDLNGACAGFVFALDMADAYLRRGDAKRILVISAEAMSRMADWTDRSTCVLFGDGAAAAVVDGGEGLLSLRLTTRSDLSAISMTVSGGNSPYLQGGNRERDYMHMAGQAVYRFAVGASTEDLRFVLARAGLEPAQVDHYLLHQANRRILDAVRERLGLPAERFPANIDHTGNTSSASLPILLDELNRAGALQSGDLLAMSAFGAGLVSGACVLRWA